MCFPRLILLFFRHTDGDVPEGGFGFLCSCWGFELTVSARQIMNWKETLEFPEDIELSPEALDLMKKLITGPENRLGAGENGVNRLLAHPWFKVETNSV